MKVIQLVLAQDWPPQIEATCKFVTTCFQILKVLVIKIATKELFGYTAPETMGNEWQTVPGPKSKSKGKDSKGKNNISEGIPGGSSSDPANAVLAQIDADWKQSKLNGTKTANGAYDSLEASRLSIPSERR